MPPKPRNLKFLAYEMVTAEYNVTIHFDRAAKALKYYRERVFRLAPGDDYAEDHHTEMKHAAFWVLKLQSLYWERETRKAQEAQANADPRR